jgi:hypothetical protein
MNTSLITWNSGLPGSLQLEKLFGEEILDESGEREEE